MIYKGKHRDGSKSDKDGDVCSGGEQIAGVYISQGFFRDSPLINTGPSDAQRISNDYLC